MHNLLRKIARLANELIMSTLHLPVETLLGLTYFILYIWLDRHRDHSPFINFPDVWMFPHYALVHTLHRWMDASERRRRWWMAAYVAAYFAWIPLLFATNEATSFRVMVAWMAAVILLLVGRRRLTNEELGRNVVHTFSKTGLAAVAAGLLALVVVCLVGSFDLLFADIYLGSKRYEYPLLFVLMVVFPLLCCLFLSRPQHPPRAKGVLGVMVDYILSPALVLYTLILYAYITRVVMARTLPTGGVAYLVCGFLSVALVCRLLQTQLLRRHFDWYYRLFPALAVPPLVLLWTGIGWRLGDYGMTEVRFYLVLLAALLTLFVAMTATARTRRFQLMALILGAAALLFTYVPGISAHHFGIRSQQARIEAVLPQVLEGGRFPKRIDYDALRRDTLRARAYIRAYGAYNYLRCEMDTEDFTQRYGAYGELAFNDYLIDLDNILEVAVRPDIDYELTGSVDLGEYTQYMPENSYMPPVYDGTDIIVMDKNEKDTLICYDVARRLADLKKIDGTEEMAARHVLTARNGTYMLVSNHINMSGDTTVAYILGNVQLFKKPEK